MILRALAGEVFRVADHAVIEARTHREQHIAVLHRHVGFIGAVHAWHADTAWIGTGLKPPSPIKRGGTRRAAALHQGGQFAGGIGENHPAAGVDHGALG